MRFSTAKETIEWLREKEHDIRHNGQGVNAGVIKFTDFVDKTTDTRYRVHEGEEPIPVHRSLVVVQS